MQYTQMLRYLGAIFFQKRKINGKLIKLDYQPFRRIFIIINYILMLQLL